MFDKIRNRLESMSAIKALCERAEQHALRDAQREPGAEHFVLAAIDLPDGTAKLAFERAGLDAASFKDAIQSQYAEALRSIGLDPLALHPQATDADEIGQPHGLYSAAASGKTLMQALTASRAAHAPLLGAHVIAAAADMEQGVAARALDAMGADRAALKRAAEDATRTFRAA